MNGKFASQLRGRSGRILSPKKGIIDDEKSENEGSAGEACIQPHNSEGVGCLRWGEQESFKFVIFNVYVGHLHGPWTAPGVRTFDIGAVIRIVTLPRAALVIHLMAADDERPRDKSGTSRHPGVPVAFKIAA